MKKFFEFEKHNTTYSTEILAGLTTFFAMAYIIFINPQMLSMSRPVGNTPMPEGGIFLATIFASIIGTLVMGLFANVPYAQGPGMGLNAFFTFVVSGTLGFNWAEALAMVFLCGLINILITVTKLRRIIIRAIPLSLQNAIGGGIGVFIAYIGLKNSGLLQFSVSGDPLPGTTVYPGAAVNPELVNFNTAAVLLGLFAVILMIVLVVKNVPGAVFLSIFITTIISVVLTLVGIPVNDAVSGAMSGGLHLPSLADTFGELKITFLAAVGPDGMGSLFSDASRLPLVIMTIFAFSLSDTFDTIGTFIGTGRRTGIFDLEDQQSLETGRGFKTKMDKALFADAIATSIGALLGTSNVTTYVESAAGIGAGGRTGFTSVVTAAMFALSIFLAPIIGFVPGIATAPALIIVGIMMLASFAEIKWTDLEEAVPAFFATIFMGLISNISYGIAAGFFFHCLIKIMKGKAKEVHPGLYVATGLFILNFIVLALLPV